VFACYTRSCAPPPVGSGGSVGRHSQRRQAQGAHAIKKAENRVRDLKTLGRSDREITAAERLLKVTQDVWSPRSQGPRKVVRAVTRDDLKTPAGKVHGKGIDSVFTGPSQVTTLPLKSARRLKKEPMYDKARVEEALKQPAELVLFDVRTLRGTQPGVTRGGVEYYLSPEYSKTGRTYADREKAGNQYPIVYHNPRTDELVLLSGSHRAVAQLVKGEPLQARYIKG
jgi:hypothetical protein